MSKTAFVFPGQGSQYVGMGKDLYEQNPEARRLFEAADEIIGFRLSALCFEGPEEDLKQTKNTQPAIFVHSVVLSKLYHGSPAAMAAGHSLGEYSALVYAGALSFEDGIKLVRLRGELMQEAGVAQQGTMAAVIGLAPDVIDQICNDASAAGVVQAANLNSPGQVVISGSVPGVRKGMELAKQRGAKLVKELQVSGAFHSPLMASAGNGLRGALLKTKVLEASIPVFANVTAKPVQKSPEIRALLYEQLTKPVRWEETIRNMVAEGAGTFVEVGPGKVLQGLIKRIDSSVRIKGLEKIADVMAD